MKWTNTTRKLPEVGYKILVVTNKGVRLTMIYSEWYHDYHQKWFISNISRWAYA